MKFNIVFLLFLVLIIGFANITTAADKSCSFSKSCTAIEYNNNYKTSGGNYYYHGEYKTASCSGTTCTKYCTGDYNKLDTMCDATCAESGYCSTVQTQINPSYTTYLTKEHCSDARYGGYYCIDKNCNYPGALACGAFTPTGTQGGGVFVCNPSGSCESGDTHLKDYCRVGYNGCCIYGSFLWWYGDDWYIKKCWKQCRDADSIQLETCYLPNCNPGEKDGGISCNANGCTRTCQPIKCYSDSDCGEIGWINNPWCSPEGENGDLYQTYRTYKCYNPGTPSSYCSNHIDQTKKKQDCLDTSYGPWGKDFCLLDNVHHSRDIYEKGCKNKACYSDDSKDDTAKVKDCNYNCYDGKCLCQNTDNNCGYEPNCENCNSNDGWACIGGNIKEYRDHYCSDANLVNIHCDYTYSNRYDCDNDDEYITSNFCKDDGNVYRTYRDYYCSNGNCLYNDNDILQEECKYGCENGECKEDPCKGITCPDKCEGDIKKYNGQCSNGYCFYSSKDCNDNNYYDEAEYYCSGSQLRKHSKYYDYTCLNNDCTIDKWEWKDDQLVENCEYGCNNNKCNPNPCPISDGSSQDCDCDSDADCPIGYYCDEKIGYGACSHQDKCKNYGEYYCKYTNDIYKCENNGYYYEEIPVKTCRGNYICDTNLVKTTHDCTIITQPIGLKIEEAEPGIKVYKQPSDYVTINIYSPISQNINFDYNNDVFTLIEGPCTKGQTSLIAGNNKCKFLIENNIGTYSFKARDKEVLLNIIDNPSLLIMTNKDKLYDRYYNDKNGVDKVLKKTYQTAETTNGIVYDLDDYITVNHPFDLVNFDNYQENPLNPLMNDNSYSSVVGLFIQEKCGECKNIIILGDDYVVPYYRKSVPIAERTLFSNKVQSDNVYSDIVYIPTTTSTFFNLDFHTFFWENPVKIVIPNNMEKNDPRLYNLTKALVDIYGQREYPPTIKCGEYGTCSYNGLFVPGFEGMLCENKEGCIRGNPHLNKDQINNILNNNVYHSSEVACNSFDKFFRSTVILIGDSKINHGTACYPWIEDKDHPVISLQRNFWDGKKGVIILNSNEEYLTPTMKIFTDIIYNKGSEWFRKGGWRYYLKQDSELSIYKLSKSFIGFVPFGDCFNAFEEDYGGSLHLTDIGSLTFCAIEGATFVIGGTVGKLGGKFIGGTATTFKISGDDLARGAFNLLKSGTDDVAEVVYKYSVRIPGLEVVAGSYGGLIGKQAFVNHFVNKGIASALLKESSENVVHFTRGANRFLTSPPIQIFGNTIPIQTFDDIPTTFTTVDDAIDFFRTLGKGEIEFDAEGIIKAIKFGKLDEGTDMAYDLLTRTIIIRDDLPPNKIVALLEEISHAKGLDIAKIKWLDISDYTRGYLETVTKLWGTKRSPELSSNILDNLDIFYADAKRQITFFMERGDYDYIIEIRVLANNLNRKALANQIDDTLRINYGEKGQAIIDLANKYEANLDLIKLRQNKVQILQQISDMIKNIEQMP